MMAKNKELNRKQKKQETHNDRQKVKVDCQYV